MSYYNCAYISICTASFFMYTCKDFLFLFFKILSLSNYIVLIFFKIVECNGSSVRPRESMVLPLHKSSQVLEVYKVRVKIVKWPK